MTTPASGSMSTQSVQTQRVSITSVDPVAGTALAKGRWSDNIQINLSYYAGPSYVVPAIGEQWFIKRIAGAWALDFKLPYNQTTQSTVIANPQQGTYQIGSTGAVQGPLHLDGSVINANAPLALASTLPDAATLAAGALGFNGTEPVFSTGTAWQTLAPAAPDGGNYFVLPPGGLPLSDLASNVQSSLGLAGTAYQLPAGGIPLTTLTSGVQSVLGLAGTAYQLPSGGIPSTDLSSEVRGLLTGALQGGSGTISLGNLLTSGEAIATHFLSGTGAWTTVPTSDDLQTILTGIVGTTVASDFVNLWTNLTTTIAGTAVGNTITNIANRLQHLGSSGLLALDGLATGMLPNGITLPWLQVLDTDGTAIASYLSKIGSNGILALDGLATGQLPSGITSTLAQIFDGGGNPLTSYLGNLSSTGLFDASKLINLSGIPSGIPQAAIANLESDLGNLLSDTTWANFLSAANSALATGASDYTSFINALHSYLGHLSPLGILDAVGSVNGLSGYLTNLSAAGIFTDITKIKDLSGNLLSAYLANMSTAGVFSPSGLGSGSLPAGVTAAISNITSLAGYLGHLSSAGVIDAVSSITGLTGYLTHLTSSGVMALAGLAAGALPSGVTSTFTQIIDSSENELSSYLANLTPGGLFDASKLFNLSEIPSIAISAISSLGGYLTHLSTSGIIDAVGSVTGLTGYLTNLSTAGVFTDITKIKDTTGNLLSAYLSNMSSSGILSGISAVTGLGGYLGHLSASGVIDAIGSVTGLSGYLTNISAAGIFTDITKIKDTGGNLLSVYLTHMSTSGTFDASQLTNLANIPAIAQASITGLVTSLGNLLPLTLWQTRETSNNLVISPNFEDSTVARTSASSSPGGGAVFGYSTAVARSGTQCYSVQTAPATTSQNDYWYLSPTTVGGEATLVPASAIKTQPGQWFYAEIYTRAKSTNTVTAGTLQLGVQLKDSTGVNGNTYTIFSGADVAMSGLSSSTWTKMSGWYQIPAGYDLVWPFVWTIGQNVGSQTFYFDDARVIEDSLAQSLTQQLFGGSAVGTALNTALTISGNALSALFSASGILASKLTGAIPAGVTAAISNITSLSGYLTHLSASGIVDAVGSVTGLSGYLTHLNTSGIVDAVGSVTGLTGYLTNLSAAGIFTDITKIKDTGGNLLSAYLANMSTAGIFSPAGLGSGVLPAGVTAAISNVTSLTGYLANLTSSGVMALAGLATGALPTAITSTFSQILDSGGLHTLTNYLTNMSNAGILSGISAVSGLGGYLGHLSVSGVLDAVGSVTGLTGYLTNLSAAGIFTDITKIKDAAGNQLSAYLSNMSIAGVFSPAGLGSGTLPAGVTAAISNVTSLGGYLTNLTSGGVLALAGLATGALPTGITSTFSQLVDSLGTHTLTNYLANMSNAGVLSGISAVTGLGGYLTHINTSGIIDAVGSITGLTGYLSNISSAGVWSDITKIKDASGNLLSAYLGNMSTAGVFSPSGLGSGALPVGVTAAIANVTSLAGYLTNLTSGGVLALAGLAAGALPTTVTSLWSQIFDASANPLSGYLANMTHGGVFSPSGLGSGSLPVGVTAAIANITSLSGYLTHLSTSGVIDAVGSVTGLSGYLTHLNTSGVIDAIGSVTGLTGYLTNLSAAGVFTDITKIKDTGGNLLSAYLNHMSTSGTFDAAQLTNIANIPALAQASITGLVTSLGSLLPLTLWQTSTTSNNLVISPNFEDSTITRETFSTSGTGAVFGYSTAVSHSGTQCYSIQTSTSISGQNDGIALSSNTLGGAGTRTVASAIKTQPGQWFYGEIWVRAAAGNTATAGILQLFLALQDSTGVNSEQDPSIAFANISGLSSSAWTKISGWYQIPAGYDLAWPFVRATNANVAHQTFYLDDARVKEDTQAQAVTQQLFGSSTISTALNTALTISGNALSALFSASGILASKLTGAIPAGVTAAISNITSLSGYLTHLSTSGVIDAVGSVTGLSGYLTHLNTSGIVDAVGSVTGLTGYLTNLSAAGIFTDITKIKDTGGNLLSAYLTNMSTAGVFSPVGLGSGSLPVGVTAAISNITSLTGYLTNLTSGGVMALAGLASGALPTTVTSLWSQVFDASSNPLSGYLANMTHGGVFSPTGLGSGVLPAGVTAAISNVTSLTGYLTHLSSAGVVDAVSSVTGLTGYLTHLSASGVIDAVGSITGLTGYLTNLSTSGVFTDLTKIKDASANTLASYLTNVSSAGVVALAGLATGALPTTITSTFSQILDSGGSHSLASYLTNMSNAGVLSSISAVTGLGGYLTNLTSGGVLALAGLATGALPTGITSTFSQLIDSVGTHTLANYLTNMSSAGVLSGISAVTGLGGYLTNLTSGGVLALTGLASGVLPAGVTAAISNITSLGGYLTNLTSAGVMALAGLASGALPTTVTSLWSQVFDASSNPLSGYLANMTHGGVFSPSGLGSGILPVGVTAAISNITSLAGYLTHLSTSGVIDAVGSVTGLPGYLTNLSAAGIFTDITKIKDLSGNLLSVYLTNMSTAGVFSPSGLGSGVLPAGVTAAISNITSLGGYLTHLSASGVIDAVGSVTGLTGYLTNLTSGGLLGLAGVPSLPTSKITSGTFLSSFFPMFALQRQAGSNLVLDPSFENASAWANAGVGAQSTDFARTGTYSWKTTGAFPGNGFYLNSTDSGFPPIYTKAGEKYRIGVWVYPATANTGTDTISLAVNTRTATGSFLSDVTSSFLSSNLTAGTWNYIEAVLTVPTDGYFFYPQILGAGIGASNVYYWDDVLVREETTSQNIISQLWGSVGATPVSTILATAVPALTAAWGKTIDGSLLTNALNTALTISGNALSTLFSASGILASKLTGAIPAGVTAAISNITGLSGYLTHLSTSGIVDAVGSVTGLSGYLTHLNTSGVIDAVGSVTGLTGYLSNLSTSGVWSDITKIKDLSGNLLSAYLTNMSNAGVFSPAGLGSGALPVGVTAAIANVTSLSGYLTNLTSGGIMALAGLAAGALPTTVTSLWSQVFDATSNPISAYLANMSNAGVFSPSGLGSGALPAGVTAAISNVTSLAGYLTHLSTGGVIDAVGSVTGLSGYLTNLSAAGIFTDITKIKDLGGNQLSAYLTNMSSAGVFSPVGLASGALPAGVTAAIANVTSLSGYLTNLTSGGVMALAGLATGALPTGITSTFSQLLDAGGTHTLASYLANMSNAGVLSGISAVTGLGGYLTNLTSGGVLALAGLASGVLPAGVTAAISNITSLGGYLTHLSTSGTFDAAQLTNISNIPAIAQASITGLVTSLGSLLPQTLWQASTVANNLVISPNFEDSTITRETYVGTGGSWAYSTDVARSGTQSFKVITSNSVSSENDGLVLSPNTLGGALAANPASAIKVQAGQWFYAEIYVRGKSTNTTTAGVIYLGTVIRDSTGVNSLTTPSFAGSGVNMSGLSSTTWTKSSGWLQIPAGYDLLWPYVYVQGQNVANQVFYLDDVRVKEDTQAQSLTQQLFGSSTISTALNTALTISGNALSALFSASGILASKLTGAIPAGVTAAISNITSLSGYLTHLSTSGVIDAVSSITGLSGYLTHLNTSGVMDAVSSITGLTGYLTNLSTAGIFTDITKIKDTSANTLASYLTNMTSAGVFSPSGLGSGAIPAGVTAAISNITSLGGYLTHLSSAGVIDAVSSVTGLGGYLTNLTSGGVMALAGLATGALPTAITSTFSQILDSGGTHTLANYLTNISNAGVLSGVSAVTGLASYLTHLSASGVIDAVGSVTGLTGYLTNLSAAGVFTDLTKIKDLSANTLSSYLTNMTSAGVFSPSGLGSGVLPAGVTAAISNVTSLGGYLTHLSSSGVIDAVGSVTGLTGYLTNLSTAGIFTDITKIKDTGGNLLSAYLGNMSSSGVLSGISAVTGLGGYLTHLNTSGILDAISSVTGLGGYLTNIGATGIWTDITKIKDLGGNQLSAYLTNMSNVGVFSPSGLGSGSLPVGVTAAIANVTSLAGYLTHMSTSGTFDAAQLTNIASIPAIAQASITGLTTSLAGLLPLTLWQARSQAGSNLIIGPDFEDATVTRVVGSYNAPKDAAGSYSTAQHHGGTQSFALTTASTASNNDAVYFGVSTYGSLFDQQVRCQPLQWYYAEVYVLAKSTNTTTAGNLSLCVLVNDSTSVNPQLGITIQSVPMSGLSSTVWTKLSGWYQVPAGYDHICPFVSANAQSVGAQTFYMDDIRFNEETQAQNVAQQLFGSSTVSAALNTALTISGNALSTLFNGAGILASKLTGAINTGTTFLVGASNVALSTLLGNLTTTGLFDSAKLSNVTGTIPLGVIPALAVSGITGLTGYLTHLSTSGVIDAVGSVTGLPGYLTHLSTSGVVDAVGSITGLTGYLTNLSTSGVFTDITKIKDLGGNLLSAYLGNMSSSGVLSGVSAVSGLGGYLTNLTSGGVMALAGLATGALPTGITSTFSQLLDAGGTHTLANYLTNMSNSGVLSGVSAVTGLGGYLTNLTSGGVLALAGLASGALPAGVTAAIANITSLSGYLTHLSTSGILDAVGSVTGLTGYLTNVSSSGIWTDLTKIKDTSANALSAYLTNMSTAGVFSPAGLGSGALPVGVTAAISNVTSLAGYLTHLNTSGVLDAVGSVTGLTGYLTNINSSGIFTDITKIKDTGGNLLSSYLTNVSNAGVLSASGISGVLATGNIPQITAAMATALLPQTLWQTSAVSNNLVISPNFEDSTIARTAVIGVGASAGYSTAVARSGTQCFSLTTITATTGQNDYWFLSPTTVGGESSQTGASAIKTQPGQWFYAEIYVRAKATNTTTGGSISLALQMKDSTGVNATTYPNFVGASVNMSGLSSSAWTKLSGWYQIPTPGSGTWDQVWPFVWTNSANVGNQVFYFDDARVKEDTQAQAVTQQLFGGSTVGTALNTALTISGNALSALFNASGVLASKLTGLATGIGTWITGGGALPSATTLGATGLTGLATGIATWITSGGELPAATTLALSKLGSGALPAGVTAAISNVTSLSGYLTHLNTSGVLDAVGSVTGLTGYLTNVSATGVWSDITKIKDTGGNLLSAYLTNMSTAGVFSPTGLGSGALPAGVTGAISNITSLSGYLTNLSSGGLLALAGVPSLPTSKITSGTFLSTFFPAFAAKQTAGTNLVLDPGFETATYWASSNGAQSTTFAHGGTHSWKVTGSASGYVVYLNGNDLGGITSIHTVAGEVFRIGVWVYAPSTNTGTGDAFYLDLNLTDSTGVNPATNATSAAPIYPNQLTQNAWNYVSSVITVPAGYDTFNPIIWFVITTAANSYYLDDAIVREETTSQNIISNLYGTVGNPLSTLVSSVIPNITAGMSSDLTGTINAIVNGVYNSSGTTGWLFSDAEAALAQLPTTIFNALGGHSVSRASITDATSSLNATNATLASHSSAILALQSQLNNSAGIQVSIPFQVPQTIATTTSGTYTFTPPSWWTLGTDAVSGEALGSGAGGDGAGFGAGGGGPGHITTLTISGTGGGTITGAAGISEALAPTVAGQGAGSTTFDDTLFVGGGQQNTYNAPGNPPGGGGMAGVGSNRYGGGAGGWSSGIGPMIPVAGATITASVGAGGTAGGGAGGAGGAGGVGRAWAVFRKAIASAFTSGGNALGPALYRYNTTVSLTDAQTVSGIWSAVPGGAATGHVLFLRANTTMNTFVYLRVWYSSGSTNYELGCYNGGTKTIFQTGTFGVTIPNNAFGLQSDLAKNYTVYVNGNPQFTFADNVGNSGAGYSVAPGMSYRSAGWGSSDTSVAAGVSHGSLTNWEFTDSGVPVNTNVVATDLSTTSATFANALTGGSLPSLTLNVPASGRIFVELFTQSYNASVAEMQMGFTMSGVNTAAQTQARSIGILYEVAGHTSTAWKSAYGRWLITGLTPGTTTFACVGNVSAGTGHFVNSSIIVLPD